jgi:hypothetical protein
MYHNVPVGLIYFTISRSKNFKQYFGRNYLHRLFMPLLAASLKYSIVHLFCFSSLF